VTEESRPAKGRDFFFQIRSTGLAVVTYSVVSLGDRWAIEHDGVREGEYASKEAAFEAIAGAASNSIKEGHGIRIEVPPRATGETALGVTP
jgi:hypothetical protein